MQIKLCVCTIVDDVKLHAVINNSLLHYYYMI